MPRHEPLSALSKSNSGYIGRFAPSPSGPLHFGSLVCAFASFLDARSNHGQWLVRIEDIDPPREQTGADQQILESLQAHQLYWDSDVLYQSSKSARYWEILDHLDSRGLSYACNCTRRRLNNLGGHYDGHCRVKTVDRSQPHAIRINTQLACKQLQRDQALSFVDCIQGISGEDFGVSGDFIIHRKDGLFAYQLAVSCDDVDQHITHVVRGSDLLETTAKQILMMLLLGGEVPSYAHIPVVTSDDGAKLSKQNHAPAIDNSTPLTNLYKACFALGLQPSKTIRTVEQLLAWAINAWDIRHCLAQPSIKECELEQL